MGGPSVVRNRITVRGTRLFCVVPEALSDRVSFSLLTWLIRASGERGYVYTVTHKPPPFVSLPLISPSLSSCMTDILLAIIIVENLSILM